MLGAEGGEFFAVRLLERSDRPALLGGETQRVVFMTLQRAHRAEVDALRHALGHGAPFGRQAAAAFRRDGRVGPCDVRTG